MRQAGVLAAAGLLALEDTPKKLAEDHANARFLACEVAKIPGIAIDPASVESNIVIFDVSGTGKTPVEISAGLKAKGVLMNGINDRMVRGVTHYDVSRADCAVAAETLAAVVG
jgi:threonine aldolase